MPVSHADDTGSLQSGLKEHITGDPNPGTDSAPVTVAHTMIIIVGALALLWLFGGVVFKKIRM
ncbi:MAG: hypothetical protein ACYCZF_13840 [Anaerolineae bacterium]